jgi:hypothetical protein
LRDLFLSSCCLALNHLGGCNIGAIKISLQLCPSKNRKNLCFPQGVVHLVEFLGDDIVEKRC